MKNIFKMMGIALLACSMIMVSCKKDDDSNNEGGQGGGGQETTEVWSASIDGTAIDVSGYHSGACGYNSNQDLVWLFQTAKRAEGQNVYFPYIISYFFGATADDAQISSVELYKDTYYSLGDEDYGDYQVRELLSFNVSNLDATSHKLSATFSVKMYEFGAYMQYWQSVDEEDPRTDEEINEAAKDAGTNLTLGVSLSNIKFTFTE